MYIYTFIHTRTYMHVYGINIYIYTGRVSDILRNLKSIRRHVSISIYKYHTYIRIHMYTCINIHVHIYIHTHIHAHTHACI